MAVAAEIEAGTFLVNGIQGILSMTSAVPSATHAMNIGSRGFSKQFKMDEIPTQDGVNVATMIATQQKEMVSYEFFPSGANRAATIAEIVELMNLLPLAVMTIVQSGTGTQAPATAKFAGTYNLMSNLEVRETREGLLSVTMALQRQQTAADGAIFEALAIAS